jgi:hypothetical protein
MSSLRSPAAVAAILLAAVLLDVRGAQLANLRCEYLTNPVGLDSPRPRLSWVIESDLRGERQTACQGALSGFAPDILSGHSALHATTRK